MQDSTQPVEYCIGGSRPKAWMASCKPGWSESQHEEPSMLGVLGTSPGIPPCLCAAHKGQMQLECC